MTFVVRCSETRKQPHRCHYYFYHYHYYYHQKNIMTAKFWALASIFFTHTKLTLPEVPSSVLSYLVMASY